MKILVVTFLLLLVFGWCEARLENEIKAENTTGPGFADQWRKCKKGEYIIKAFQIQTWKGGISGLRFFCFDGKNEHRDTIEVRNVEAPSGRNSFDYRWRKVVYWLEAGNCQGVEGYFIAYQVALENGNLQNINFKCLSDGEYGEVGDRKKPDIPTNFGSWSDECSVGTAITGVRVWQQEGNKYFTDINFLCTG